MLHSARRLGHSVATGRFHWQRPDSGAATPTPEPMPFKLTDASPGDSPATNPQELQLPSVTAERIAAMERDAFAKGYAQGERAGDDAAAARIDGMVQRLASAIEDVAALRMNTLRTAERDILRLAIAMAERIVRREVGVDPELLAVMARVAIERLGEHVAASIHLNPVDFAATKTRPDANSSVTIVADASVPRGGCLVRSAVGSIDVGIDSQIRELSRELLGEETGGEDRSHGVVSGV